MLTTLVFLTDERGLLLTEHAAAAAVVTQGYVPRMIIFCIGFLPIQPSILQTAAKARGFTVEYRTLAVAEGITDGYEAIGPHAHVSSATLLKMAALHAISKEFDRALYLDGDVLLMQPFDVGSIEFDGATIAAVYDMAWAGASSTELDFFSRCDANGRSPHYFNAGVIAADFTNWNDELPRQYDAYLQDHAKSCDYKVNCGCPDQCAWNRTFESKWKRLPLTFNFQAYAIFSELWTTAAVRHYVGPTKFLPFKPWRNDSLDTQLLTKARSILGLPAIGMPLAGLARSLNRIRHGRTIEETNQALVRIGQLSRQAM